jgi:hypothetical protein
LESLLILAKFAVVLTVIYAGMNIHQLTSSYGYLVAKAEEFRTAVTEEGGLPRLARLNIIFYVLMPFAYLALLRFSTVPSPIVAVLALKFMITGSLDLWVERRILTGQAYSLAQHYLSRVDNLLNIAAAMAVIRVLLTGTLAPN